MEVIYENHYLFKINIKQLYFRRQNAEEKEAERQVANKILMDLKQKQNSGSKVLFSDDLSFENPLFGINRLSENLNSTSDKSKFEKSISYISRSPSSVGISNENLEINQNPLNKLMMMDIPNKVNN